MDIIKQIWYTVSNLLFRLFLNRLFSFLKTLFVCFSFCSICETVLVNILTANICVYEIASRKECIGII